MRTDNLYLRQLALAQLCAERYKKSTELAKETVRRMNGFIEAHITLAYALGRSKHSSDAKATIGEFDEVAQAFGRQHLVFSEEVKTQITLSLEKSELGQVSAVQNFAPYLTSGSIIEFGTLLKFVRCR